MPTKQASYITLDSILKGIPNNSAVQPNHLFAAEIQTPLGPMVAISDVQKLYLLEFFQRKNLAKDLRLLASLAKANIKPGKTPIIESIKEEIEQYFAGNLKSFKTPYQLLGTEFQQKVWQTLSDIPHGKTISYKKQAESLGQAQSFRAVANANGKNRLAIIIPCHRVINSSGKLGGYGGGLEKKQWLLKHERQ